MSGERPQGRPVTRFQFLRGDFGADPPPIRPPWSLSESEFLQACSRCGDCIRACPQGILEVGRAGFPRVDFGKGACTFCRDCAAACQEGALGGVDGERPWSTVAGIGSECFADRGILCRVCGEECVPEAIRFFASPGHADRPHVVGDRCTGCGACVGVCPAHAIELVVR